MASVLDPSQTWRFDSFSPPRSANVCYQSIFFAFFLIVAWSLLRLKTYTN